MHDQDASSLAYRACLPLGWETAEGADAATRAAWRHDNIALLRALATLESLASLDGEHEAESALGKAMERIEAKLDIMLGMMARLVARNTDPPPVREVTLSASALSWPCAAEDQPPADAEVLLLLTLSPRLPEPLRLPARVSVLEQRCRATLTDRDPELEDWLTRTLFRYHRRALQARRQE